MDEMFKTVGFYKENINKQCAMYHRADDREYWDKLKGTFYDVLVKAGEVSANPYRILTLTSFMRVQTDGNRRAYEDVYFARRAELVRYCMLEAIEQQGIYRAHLLDLMWMILEETQWLVPAHNQHSKAKDIIPHFGDSGLDLCTAETAAVLSMVYYIHRELYDSVSDEIGNRLREKIKKEVYVNILENDYTWMGYGRIPNNWNPWIVSNTLKSVINLGNYGDLELQVIARCVYVLDMYYSSYPDDGGCDEGSGYWNHAGGNLIVALYALYLLTDGKFDLLKSAKVKNISEFIINTYTTRTHLLGFNDVCIKEGYDWGFYCWIAKRIGNERLLAFSKMLYDSDNDLNVKTPPRFSSDKILYRGETLELLQNMEPVAKNFPLSYYYDSIKLLILREKADGSGLFLSVKANHNKESHNHNDTGNFIIYKNSVPFIVDVGSKEYTAKTFSAQRYEIWNTRSKYHNLPLFGGAEQQAGASFAAKNVTVENDTLKCRLEDAYDCNFIESYTREIGLDRAGKRVVLKEDISLSKELDVEFTFVTPAEVVVSDKLYLEYMGEKLEISFDKELTCSIENIEDDDTTVTNVWGNTLKRIILKAPVKCKSFVFIFGDAL